jgi:hypothetical protein
MKVVLVIVAHCVILYQTSAIAKDQDGIVIFGQGILGCAKNPVVTTTNDEMHVKCNIGSNTVVDISRKISATCSGFIEGMWRRAPDKISYTNISIDNNNFICHRYTSSTKFEFDRLATAGEGVDLLEKELVGAGGPREHPDEENIRPGTNTRASSRLSQWTT